MPELTVISLGWGVQSWTLAAMVALGELPPVDFAIHADTTHERSATYALAAEMGGWLKQRGVKVVTVTDASTQYIETPHTASDNRFIPAYTLAPVESPTGRAGDIAPVTGYSKGQLRRQCTGRWKIDPLRRFLRAELARRALPAAPGTVEQWIGISYDEFHRARTSDVAYINHRYPLLERHMTRQDCIQWLQTHNLEVPGKSACVFCPYHNAETWQTLKRGGGADWDHAVLIDNAIRHSAPPYPAFVHAACKPLAEAIVIPEDQGLVQGGLFDRPEVEDAPCDSGACFI